jgi:hypothetical protein
MGYKKCWSQWLMPVIPATQEAEIRRIMVRGQPEQIVHQTLSRKTLHKNRAGGVAQGEGPEFKLQYCQKIKKSVGTKWLSAHTLLLGFKLAPPVSGGSVTLTSYLTHASVSLFVMILKPSSIVE